MKRCILAVLVIGILFGSVIAIGAQEAVSGATKEWTIDSISAASKAFYYAKSSLTGEDLWKAIEARAGAVVVATANEDGTPNAAVIIPGISKDRTALIFGIAPNQTLENLKARHVAVVTIYLYTASATDKFERNKGARIIAELITDQTEIARLAAENKDRGASAGSTFLKIVKILPLG